MNKLLQSKLTIRIASVIIAIILWFVFLNEENPQVEKIFTIPIKVINENSLTDKGFFLKNEYPETMEVVVKGREKILDKVTANDFNLQTDFSQIDSSGISRIILGIPELDMIGVKILKIEPETLELDIGMLGNRELPVNIEFSGEVADKYKILEIIQVPETIIIDGEEEEISKVATAKAVIDVDGLKSSFSSKKDVIILDAEGNEITGLKRDYIVDAKITIGKEVTLVPQVVGSPHENYYFNTVELNPRTVFIIGDGDILESITNIQTTQIDITGIDKDTVFEITPILPSGVNAADGYRFAEASVSIGDKVEKTVIINSEDILLVSSNKDNFIYTITPKYISVTVRLRDSDFNFFSGRDLNASLNVGNMEKSPISDLPLIIDTPLNVEILSKPYVKLEIKRK